MIINDLINMLNEIKEIHPEIHLDDGTFEVFFEIPVSANHQDYDDMKQLE